MIEELDENTLFKDGGELVLIKRINKIINHLNQMSEEIKKPSMEEWIHNPQKAFNKLIDVEYRNTPLYAPPANNYPKEDFWENDKY